MTERDVEETLQQYEDTCNEPLSNQVIPEEYSINKLKSDITMTQVWPEILDEHVSNCLEVKLDLRTIKDKVPELITLAADNNRYNALPKILLKKYGEIQSHITNNHAH